MEKGGPCCEKNTQKGCGYNYQKHEAYDSNESYKTIEDGRDSGSLCETEDKAHLHCRENSYRQKRYDCNLRKEGSATAASCSYPEVLQGSLPETTKDGNFLRNNYGRQRTVLRVDGASKKFLS